MSRIKSYSLWLRISVVNMLLIVITALCIGGILMYTFVTHELQARYAYNVEIAKLLAKNSELAVYTEQKSALQHLLSQVKHLPGIRSIRISGQQGQALASFQNESYPANPLENWLWHGWVSISGQDFSSIRQNITSDTQQDEALLFSSQSSTQDEIIGQLVLDPDQV